MSIPVAVLGAGFGGLSSAIHLALHGFDVTVVEAQDRPGGKAGEIRDGAFRFDTGPSVVTLKDTIDSLFTNAGRPSPMRWRELDPVARYLFPSGRVIDTFRDAARTTAALDAREARAYLDLLDEARALYEAAAPIFVHGPPPTLPTLMRYGVRHGARARPFSTLPGLLARHGATGDVRDLFLRFATYFGADPFRAPAILHNIAWVELGLGVHAPEGGVAALVTELTHLASSLGVEIRYGCTVTSLTPRRAAAPLVTVRDRAGASEVIDARFVVSNLDRVRTASLAGRSVPERRAEPSLSGLVVLMAVDHVRPDVAHHTLLMPRRYEAEFEAMRAGRSPTEPTLYVAQSSVTWPGDAPSGAGNWFVMANAPALTAAGQGIDEASYARTVIDVLTRRVGPIDGRHVATLGPRHLAAFGERGAIYGRAPHGLLSTMRPPGTLPGVRDLVLAGGTVHPGGGIPLAIASGRHAASAVARKARRVVHRS